MPSSSHSSVLHWCVRASSNWVVLALVISLRRASAEVVVEEIRNHQEL